MCVYCYRFLFKTASICLLVNVFLVSVHSQTVYCINTISTVIEVEEKDIDGDFLRCVDIPLMYVSHTELTSGSL